MNDKSDIFISTHRYDSVWDEYWAREKSGTENSNGIEKTADQIAMISGLASVLDVGAGRGDLVGALLQRGLNARGVDVSAMAVTLANEVVPHRFARASVLSLPFQDEIFHTVVSSFCLEHLLPEDLPLALEEIYRITGRNFFLNINTSSDNDPLRLTQETRAWWERKCFEAGFRKHPWYYKINGYESLNQLESQISILLEKIPRILLSNYPLSSLNEERGLHMDMLRDTGERSDAHVIRYQWACNYIKTGDRVLDAACGLGYGSHVIHNLAKPESIVGVDGSLYAADYANSAFGFEDRVLFQIGMLPQALSKFKDASFDVIVSFETLEHVENPPLLMREFNRLLTPGGRLIVSVPNDWSDETGEDPNPYHLHVYNWQKLKEELSESFILEESFAQTASQCKALGSGAVWQERPRSLHGVEFDKAPITECEWWLVVAMKSPFDTERNYKERVFNNLVESNHPSVRYADFYDNPWLMHAMVNSGYRLKGRVALDRLSSDVLSTTAKTSNDYAAALCVKAYRILESKSAGGEFVASLISRIDEVVNHSSENPMNLRWRVSLLFAKAQLLLARGALDSAKLAFLECAESDARSFGVHLITKTTEAWYMAGKISYSLGEMKEALSCWQKGVNSGADLLAVSLDDIVINRSFPNRFNHGDGIREYCVAWDNISRCANGIHLLRQGGELDYSALENCFQTEYSEVTRDLIECRSNLEERTDELLKDREVIINRTISFELTGKELVERTAELVETRAALAERTQELIDIRKVVVERTQELVDVRQEVVERTQELVEIRQDLADRTLRLEAASKELKLEKGE